MPVFITLSSILGLTALFAYLNARVLHLQETIGLMVLALAFSAALMLLAVLGLPEPFTLDQAFVTRLSLDETLLNGVLCFMLFSGSINVPSRTLGEEKWIILTLAIGATLLGALLTGVAIWWLLDVAGLASALALGGGIGLMFALAFGALISPTDPIAALAILGKIGLPPRLTAILNGESLFNDGVGVVVFTICVTVATGLLAPTAMDAVILFLHEVFGGVLLGLAAAALLHHMLMRTADYGNQVLISLAVVTAGFAVARQLEVSGPIAMVVTGLIAGNVTLLRLSQGLRTSFEAFWQGVDEVLNALLFVLIGLHVALVPGDTGMLALAAVAIVVCLLARWLSVRLALTALAGVGALRGDVPGLGNLLTWGGLRGGLAVAMALSLPDVPQKDLILNMTYGVVAFSIIVQGLTIARLFSTDRLQGMLAPAAGTAPSVTRGNTA
jgi:CPA1 family monovalent cation:H+ antiporter